MGADVKNDIGAVQWLNATGLQTGFDNPSYGIVYSYGLPTIGNGRRTFGDFVEQSKNHISQERLKRVLTDSLTNALSAVGVDANEVKGNISQMAEELLTGNLTEECRKIAGELVEKYGALATVLSDSKLGTYIHGLSELRSLKINMDDLPGTALKILRVLDRFIPETYKSELYSAFIENFSPEVVEILANATKCSISGGSARNCVVAGLAASAKNLSNYGLNFFDEGTFDVPVYSAFGANVSAFRNANVSRMGYDLGDYIENDARLKDYRELLLTEAIPAYGAPYYGNGPQIGLHRTDYYFPWDASDDPSFSEGANHDFVDANGIALLDSEGFLLNDWNCYDADGPMEQKRKSAQILAKDSKVASDLSNLVTMLVENTGEAPLDGFEVRYYYRDDDGDKDVDFYSSPFASGTKIGAGGNLYYVSFLYSTTVLNPGEKSDFGNGVNFEIHNSGWTAGYDASEDPSHYGLNGTELVAADSAIVLDLNGNLLWGHAPQPKFGEEYKTKDVYENLIDVENGAVYVNVAERGTYTLETVNAAGMPLVSLFNGIWGEGVHSVSLANHTFAPGSYLVLRRGNEILSWRIFK